MGLGGGCQVGRSVSKGPEGGLDHLRFLPVGSVWGSGDQAENTPECWSEQCALFYSLPAWAGGGVQTCPLLGLLGPGLAGPEWS